MLTNKTTVHIRPWQVSTQAHAKSGNGFVQHVYFFTHLKYANKLLKHMSHLFIDQKGAGQYAFSLNVDFFAVEGMRVRGATMSAGIISLACLNLPPKIHFKPENMYLSIIRGPKELHLTELNHYMKPLVDDMVHSWEKGIWFSCIALHQAGRVTNSAIVATVMDLPATRKSSGLPGLTSHFYSTVCQCYHQSTLSRTDFWKLDKERLSGNTSTCWGMEKCIHISRAE